MILAIMLVLVLIATPSKPNVNNFFFIILFLLYVFFTLVILYLTTGRNASIFTKMLLNRRKC